MSSSMDDIQDLLNDILDDSKPLPVAAKPATTKAAKPAPKAAPAPVAPVSDEDFLTSLTSDEPPKTPMEVAQAAEVGGEMVLADALNPEVTQRVTQTPDDAAEEEAEHETQTKGIFADSADREEGALIQPIKMPTFTAADFASTMDIRNFATLVKLNTARWHAKVKDRQASKDAANANEAEEGAFETRKHLLGGANAALKAIHKAIDEARSAHYEMTLPWSTTAMHENGRRTGGRLLPNTLFVDYTTVMAQKKQQMLSALNAFEPEYPKLIEAARKKLGKRFNATEYPNVSSIRNHFDLSFDFEPIPKGDDFAGLPQAQLDALARKINENTQKQAEGAMQEVWMRLYDAVSRMAERLSSPDKLFHNTLVQNVRDVARLLQHLNVTSDPKVEALRKRVEKHLCQHDPKVLRENATLRTQTAAHAQSIIEDMNK